MSSFQFDFTQTTFMFSWLSNYSSAPCASPQDLADFVYAQLYGNASDYKGPGRDNFQYKGLLPTLNAQGALNYAGSWSLEWGPGVYEINPCAQRADNTAFVVYNSALNTYLVAIAGTDPNSFLDWALEDFQVGKKNMFNWPTDAAGLDALMDPTKKPARADVVTTNEQISYGTAFGVHALLCKLVLTSNVSNEDATLGAYLKKIPAGANVVFTGHSLGGALSPTLARWTKEQLGDNNTVYAMPIAGPTPGNDTYQKKWDAMFQPETLLVGKEALLYNTNNQITDLNKNVCNNFDVVPHGWDRIYKGQKLSANVGEDVFVRSYFYSETLVWPTLGCQLGVVVSDKISLKDDVIGFKYVISNLSNRGRNAEMTKSQWMFAYDPSIPEADKPSRISVPYIMKIKGNPTNSAAVHVLDHDVITGGKNPSNQYRYVLEDNGFTELLTDIGMVHVWGYSTDAFGIPFDVMKGLYWYKVIEPSA